MFQSGVVNNTTALAAFIELAKKVTYKDGKFVGADFFNETETPAGLETGQKYLIAWSKVEVDVTDGSIKRKYYLEQDDKGFDYYFTVPIDIPLTKNDLIMSEIKEDLRYTEDHEWDLSLSTTEFDVILQTLAVKEFNNSSDSTYLSIRGTNGDTILTALIMGDLNWSSEDSVTHIGTPGKVVFSGKNFTGRLEYQILKK